jgi:hypothetical protein
VGEKQGTKGNERERKGTTGNCHNHGNGNDKGTKGVRERKGTTGKGNAHWERGLPARIYAFIHWLL